MTALKTVQIFAFPGNVIPLLSKDRIVGALIWILATVPRRADGSWILMCSSRVQ